MGDVSDLNSSRDDLFIPCDSSSDFYIMERFDNFQRHKSSLQRRLQQKLKNLNSSLDSFFYDENNASGD